MKTAEKKQVNKEKSTMTKSEQEHAPEVFRDEMMQDQDNAEPVGPMAEQIKNILQVVKPMTAEERITNAENFKILTTRYAFLKQKDEELKRFNLQNSGTNAKLILKNQAGQDFEVTNSDVIQKAVNVMTDELTKLLTDTRQEVVNFAI